MKKHGDRDSTSASVGAPFLLTGASFSADREVVMSAISELVRPTACVRSPPGPVLFHRSRVTINTHFHTDYGNLA